MADVLDMLEDLEDDGKTEIIVPPKDIKGSTVKDVKPITQKQCEDNRELKLELRKLVESLAQGHKKYQEYGFKLIGEAKARVHEIIDLL